MQRSKFKSGMKPEALKKFKAVCSRCISYNAREGSTKCKTCTNIKRSRACTSSLFYVLANHFESASSMTQGSVVVPDAPQVADRECECCCRMFRGTQSERLCPVCEYERIARRPKMILTPGSDWTELSEGGHMRKRHLSGRN